MPNDFYCHCKPHCLTFAKGIVHSGGDVFLCEGRHRFVRVRKRVLEKLYNLSFTLHGCGAVVFTDVDWRLLTNKAGCHQIINMGNMLCLCGEIACTLELSGG